MHELDVRDRTGLLQLVFRPEEAPEAHGRAGDLRSEDVISVAGDTTHTVRSDVSPDARVFVYTFLLSVVTGIVFGLVPALKASRPDLWNTLKDAVALSVTLEKSA